MPPTLPKESPIITPEQAARAAKVVIHKYALLPNCKKGRFYGVQKAQEQPSSKNWIAKSDGLTDAKIAEGILTGKVCYAASHSRFSRMIVLDVDNPHSDSDLVEDVLNAIGWKYKCFDSGRGRHYWIFFTDITTNVYDTFPSKPAFLFAVGKYIIDNHLAPASREPELFGCSGAFIKLPLQFDPYHGKLVLPIDESDKTISDYRFAIDFAEDIHYNPSGQLEQFIAPILAQRRSRTSSGNRHAKSGIGDFYDWISSVTVGEGESNLFMLDLAFRAHRAGVAESEIPELVEELYRNGIDDGRVWCKDSLRQWLSKARSRVKWVYSKTPSGPVTFSNADIAWVVQNARHTKSPNVFIFLSLHLWASKRQDHGSYFLSHRYATNFGISTSAFQRLTNLYLELGVIRIVSKGDQHPEGQRATHFAITQPPDQSEPKYEMSPGEFARLCDDTWNTKVWDVEW